MVIVMVVIQMVPGFYIGSRSINILLQGDTGRKAVAEAVVTEEGILSSKDSPWRRRIRLRSQGSDQQSGSGIS